MAIETYQLFEATARVTGRANLARALHVGEKHTYNLTADPMTIEVPCRNDADRMTNVFEMLATYPAGRPALILWRQHFNELFARLVDRETAKPLTPETVILEAQEVCAEVGDVLRECKPGFLPNRLAQQCAEAIARLERLMAMAEAADDIVPLRRAK